MPLKKGGGNKLQYYDESTGQYDDEQKSGLNDTDKENLVMYHYFGLDDDTIKIHFPNYLIHDSEYCDIFCKAIRAEVFIKDVSTNKCKYLLTYQPKRDKSSFLNSIGYNMSNIDCLHDDIEFGTDFNTINFALIDCWGIRVEAKTILKNKIVTTIWMVDEELGLKFVTLIPGGDKKWKK